MSLTTALNLAQVSGWAPALWLAFRHRMTAFWLTSAVINVAGFVNDLIPPHMHALAPLNGALAIACLWMAWRNRRRRKRTRAWLGAKTKALIARLARALKPAPRPRLRPVPQRAGA